MSRKALLVGLEYPSESHCKSPSSVSSILEFKSCLTKHMDVPATNFEMIFDTSPTDWGDRPFRPKDVISSFFQFVHGAKEGDLLIFAFSGHGSYGDGRGAALYLGLDDKGKGVYMDAKVFKNTLDQLNRKRNPNKLYMFISACGSGGLLVNFHFINQLTNVERPIVRPPRYPTVIAFMSSMVDKSSMATFNHRWECTCSNFLYTVVRAIETEKVVSNLILGQCINLILREMESIDAAIRLAGVDLVNDEQKRKRRLEIVAEYNRCGQVASLLCTSDECGARFLS